MLKDQVCLCHEYLFYYIREWKFF